MTPGTEVVVLDVPREVPPAEAMGVPAPPPPDLVDASVGLWLACWGLG